MSSHVIPFTSIQFVNRHFLLIHILPVVLRILIFRFLSFDISRCVRVVARRGGGSCHSARRKVIPPPSHVQFKYTFPIFFCQMSVSCVFFSARSHTPTHRKNNKKSLEFLNSALLFKLFLIMNSCFRCCGVL